MRAVTVARLGIPLLLLSAAAMPAPAAQVTFDSFLLFRDPRPPIELPLLDGDLVNATFSYLGITFGCFNGTNSTLNLCTNAGTGGDAYARSSVSARSSPNVVNLSATGVPVFDERYGYLKATFATPVAAVSIDALPVAPPEGFNITVNRPFLQAFNSLGQFLGTASYVYGSCNPNTTQCPWQTLTINRPASDIKFVAFSSFSSSGGIMYGQFDNLNTYGDTDADGVADNVDNCPFYPTANQADTDANGRGDACECSDQDLNGRVNVADIVAISAAIFNPALLTPLCDGNNDGLCNVSDIVAANRTIFSPKTSICARQPVPGP
jgi:hypothetical protein